jgi:glycosyltransferase involved in cell wall biosynthesis
MDTIKRVADATPDGSISVLEGGRRVGYPATVNRGLSSSDRDVVVLNSDTEVTEAWLDELIMATRGDATIGTVSPVSNDATLCSVPEGWRSNLLPVGYSPDEFARTIHRLAGCEPAQIPVANGSCFLIRRRLIDVIGEFDTVRYGLGYGEEVDFCLRAAREGFTHLVAPGSFVYHRGQGSFGREREPAARLAEGRLRHRFPEYRQTIARAMANDPLEPVRERITVALAAHHGLPDRRHLPFAVTHLVHGWPPFQHGGTEGYARSLAHAQTSRMRVSSFVRSDDPDRSSYQQLAVDDHGVRVRATVNHFDQRNPMIRNALVSPRLSRAFAQFLDDERPDLLHVHHLAGHAATLPWQAVQRGIPIVIQVQDWWPACARANLFRPGRGLCPGPAPSRCDRCLPLTRLQPEPWLGRVLHVVRKTLMRRSLSLASAYIMGTETIHRWYRGHGLLQPGVPVHVLPYGIEPPHFRRDRESAGRPLRFGVVGAVMAHKGVDVAAAAFREIDPSLAILEIWGDLEADPEYARRTRAGAYPPTTTFHGRFAEPDEVFSRLDVLIVPSVGHESFGIVAREAMARGVPVIASRLGALAELPLEGCGAWFEPGDCGALLQIVRELSRAPDRVQSWASDLPRITTASEHERLVATVYREVAGDRVP